MPVGAREQLAGPNGEVFLSTVGVNSAFRRELNAPFGGYKASGVGREGGMHSWLNYTQTKTTVIAYD